jgi:hypothetical protein
MYSLHYTASSPRAHLANIHRKRWIYKFATHVTVGDLTWSHNIRQHIRGIQTFFCFAISIDYHAPTRDLKKSWYSLYLKCPFPPPHLPTRTRSGTVYPRVTIPHPLPSSSRWSVYCLLSFLCPFASPSGPVPSSFVRYRQTRAGRHAAF